MSDAKAVWNMPPSLIQQAEGRWEKVDTAIKTGILADEILLQSKLKTDILSGQVVGRRSGNLSRGVFIDPESISAMQPYVGFVGVGKEVPYAADVEYGTGVFHEPDAHDPWTQEAPEGSVLHFEAGGEEIFARHATHYGMEPRHFMEVAIQQNEQALRDNVVTRVERALTE